MKITACTWKAAAKRWRSRALKLEEEIDAMEWHFSNATERQATRMAQLEREYDRQGQQLADLEHRDFARWLEEEKKR